MTDFKEYIRNNPGMLDERELPEGHQARFEAKLDAAMASADKTQLKVSVRRKRIFAGIFGAVGAAAAAAIAAVIFIGRPSEDADWFGGVADDPAAVYLAYSEKAASMYREILTKDIDGKWEATVGSVTRETVPMIDLLPEEMDDTAKAAILKEYYGTILNGLNKINKIKEL